MGESALLPLLVALHCALSLLMCDDQHNQIYSILIFDPGDLRRGGLLLDFTSYSPPPIPEPNIWKVS